MISLLCKILFSDILIGSVNLMLSHNKVTHIYELLKTYGSDTQIRYGRKQGEWHRTDIVAAKHAYEYSVNPLSGNYSQGEEHAPLIYHDDPKKNASSQLQDMLTQNLGGVDDRIVSGCLETITRKPLNNAYAEESASP